jgi:hypothetical protein
VEGCGRSAAGDAVGCKFSAELWMYRKNKNLFQDENGRRGTFGDALGLNTGKVRSFEED